jgi:hypothetical protein
MPIDPLTLDDPCDVYKRLRRAYLDLISGTATQSVEYLANGVQRRVSYSQADLSNLKVEMERARAECMGIRGRRFAIVGGARRRFW